MSSSNKNLFLVLAGIIIVAVAYFVGISPMLQEKEQIDNNIVQLQNKLNDLNTKKANQAAYEEGIKVYNEKYEEKLALFPATIDQEYTITFIEGIRQAYEFDATSLTMGEPSQFYVLGANTATTEAAPAETTEDAAATTTEPTAPVITEDTLVCYTAEFPVEYEGSYDGIKDFLNYVAGYKNRMTVDTTNIAYDPGTDLYTGEMVFTAYAIAGAGRTDTPLNIDTETGTDNLFEGGGNGGSSSSLTKYDEDNGAGIAADYDFYVMLNPSSSDVSPKVVGQKDRDASQVSSDKNEEETLTMEFYEKDGKNYVTYTLGDKSYEAEVTATDDATVYVTSTARVDGTDLSGLRVTIVNKMAIPVYVKVSGDDATSPRFNVVSKSGKVKIYK